ncbi:MAG: hypothetical protein ABWY51_02465 [Gaiellaceae bacterium]
MASQHPDSRLPDLWSDLWRAPAIAVTAISALALGIIAAAWTLLSATGSAANVWGANVATTLLGTGITILAVDFIAKHQADSAARRERQPMRESYQAQKARLGSRLANLLCWMLVDAWAQPERPAQDLHALEQLPPPAKPTGIEACFVTWFCALPVMRLAEPPRTTNYAGETWNEAARAELGRLESRATRMFIIYETVLEPDEVADLDKVLDFLSYAQQWIAAASAGTKTSPADRVDRLAAGGHDSLRRSLSRLWPDVEPRSIRAAAGEDGRPWMERLHFSLSAANRHVTRRTPRDGGNIGSDA